MVKRQEIRMVPAWWNSVKRMVKSLQTDASNTLQSISQPGCKEELAR